ncbi:DUF2244 domain-containing protein [Pseudooceanicola sp.]|uniref:DUF2244 domain-containing protein n=1 Tax=Pseudooceanicola sp. TaxID=1914328 RepID=UPI00262029EB|nr:DUF2244 domain-containing protein [Pseudooceanicola sp.]MDF1854830.1 DUF2244 domain-containing protein [Pseudooceanicola sp.]
MPYEWSNSHRRLTLWPHRSLPLRGFAVVIGLFFVLAMVPMFALIGTVFLWTLLPFGLAALAALWLGLRLNYRAGDIIETLEIGPERVVLLRRNPDRSELSWTCNSYWARAELHLRGGPVPNYVTLTGNGRQVEIGAFLSEGERRALYGELASALAEQKGRGAPG